MRRGRLDFIIEVIPFNSPNKARRFEYEYYIRIDGHRVAAKTIIFPNQKSIELTTCMRLRRLVPGFWVNHSITNVPVKSRSA